MLPSEATPSTVMSSLPACDEWLSMVVSTPTQWAPDGRGCVSDEEGVAGSKTLTSVASKDSSNEPLNVSLSPTCPATAALEAAPGAELASPVPAGAVAPDPASPPPGGTVDAAPPPEQAA